MVYNKKGDLMEIENQHKFLSKDRQTSFRHENLPFIFIIKYQVFSRMVRGITKVIWDTNNT